MRIAYSAALYGREYLAWAIRSVQDFVDEFFILYTDRPSFGQGMHLPCPETEEELRLQAIRFLKKPLHWHKGIWGTEGEHRSTIMRIAEQVGADLILSLDTDEVWDRETVEQQLDAAEKAPARDTLVPFIHFWRSFNYVCSDPSMPVRIIKPGGSGIRYADQKVPVLHFGYAQREEIIRYKIQIHGHRAEWRDDWLDSKFLAWKPGDLTRDVHPTCGWNTSFADYFWNVRPVDSTINAVVDRVMPDHPYRRLEIIR